LTAETIEGPRSEQATKAKRDQRFMRLANDVKTAEDQGDQLLNQMQPTSYDNGPGYNYPSYSNNY
jgi:hypothetical protein